MTKSEISSNPRIPFQLSTDRPRLTPPSGKPLIVHIAINLEVWPFDQPMPRAILAAPHGRAPQPDLANFSWVEYGLRCGVPRLIRILSERELCASNIMSARLPEIYPSCASAALEAGWELTAHSMVQRSLQGETDEAAVIAETLDTLEAFAGYRPKGWLGPGFGEMPDTPDLLRAAGIDYIHEWMVDDLPCWMRTKHGPMIAMPYALDLNDVTVFGQERHSAEEYVIRFRDTIDGLAPELPDQPRIITIALHPHIIAVPYRIRALERVLDLFQSRDDTIFMTGAEIADWFKIQVDPAGQA